MSEAKADVILRTAVAKQVKLARNLERSGGYNYFRSDLDYKRNLEGVFCLFNYLKCLKGSATVLDIGAGRAEGVDSLAQTYGIGLTFQATGLIKRKNVNPNMSRDYRITSAEVLRGIPDNSIAGVMSVYSVTYSHAPDMVMKRINDILIPGGVFKGCFFRPDDKKTEYADLYRRTHFNTADPFKTALIRLGFKETDIAVVDNGRCELLLAIKPGGPVGISAQQLLEVDRERSTIQQKQDFIDLLAVSFPTS